MSQYRIFQMYQKIVNVTQKEMQGYLNDQLSELIKSLGIDMAQLQGMVSQKTNFNPYVVLGLDRSASDDEVKKRYHELLHKLHPDTAGVEGTSFLLQMVLAAYELIKKGRRWQP